MVQAKPCYVEDRVTADACVIKMLRSPHAHALITHLDVSKAEALPGVVHVITHLNCRIFTIPRVVRAHRNHHRLTAVCSARKCVTSAIALLR